MKHNTPTGQLGRTGPRTVTAATGTATSSLVDNHSSSSRSSYSSSSSYGTPAFRNKNLSPGARSREHPLRPHPTTYNTRTTPPGFPPHVHADMQTTSCTTPAGSGPRPPTGLSRLGTPSPRPTMVHAALPSADAAPGPSPPAHPNATAPMGGPQHQDVGDGPRPPTIRTLDGVTHPSGPIGNTTRQSPTSPPRRAFRSNSARPDTPCSPPASGGRNTQRTMASPPSVAPGPDAARTLRARGPHPKGGPHAHLVHPNDPAPQDRTPSPRGNSHPVASPTHSGRGPSARARPRPSAMPTHTQETCDSPCPQPPHDVGRKRSRKQLHPQRLIHYTVRRARPHRAQSRPSPVGPPSRGDGPAPTPPAPPPPAGAPAR